MKVSKFLSLLMAMLVGFGMLFSSCNKDEGEDSKGGDSTEEYNTAALNAGKSFFSNYEVVAGDAETADKAIAGVAIYASCQSYWSNKSDSKWRQDFLRGIAMGKYGTDDPKAIAADQIKGVEGVLEVLDKAQNADITSAEGIAQIILDLAPYLSKK